MSKQYDITIPREIIEELQNMQKRLMELVETDEELARNIIEYTLLLGKNKGVYVQDMRKLVWNKYPNMYKDPKQEDKAELLEIIYYFSKIVMCKHKIIQDYILMHSSKEESSIFKAKLREVIEEEIIKIFYPGGVESDCEMKDLNEPVCDIMGEVTEQIDSIEL